MTDETIELVYGIARRAIRDSDRRGELLDWLKGWRLRTKFAAR